MKKHVITILTALLSFCLFAAAPVVTNVIADPQPGRVVISYILSHADELPCNVSVEVSADGGANYTIFPTALSGDIGEIPATASGADHQIIWYPAQDNVAVGDNYRVKVVADDSQASLISISMDITQGAPGTILNFTTSQTLDDAEDYRVCFGDQSVPMLPNGSLSSFTSVVPLLPAGSTSLCIKRADLVISQPFAFNVLTLPVTNVTPGSMSQSVVNDIGSVVQTITDDLLPLVLQMGSLTVNNLSMLQSELNTLAGYNLAILNIVNDLSPEAKTLLDQLMLTSGVFEQTKDLLDLTEKVNGNAKTMHRDGVSYTANITMLGIDLISCAITEITRTIAMLGSVASMFSGGSALLPVALVVVILTCIDKTIDGLVPCDLEYLYVQGEQPVLVPDGGHTPIRLMGRFTTQSAPPNAILSAFTSTVLSALGLSSWFNFIVNAANSYLIDMDESIGVDQEEWQFTQAQEYPVCPLIYGIAGELEDYINDQINWDISNIPLLGTIIDAIPTAQFNTQNNAIAQYNWLGIGQENISGNSLGGTSLVYNAFRFIRQPGILGNVIGYEYPAFLNSDSVVPCNIVVQQSNPNQISVNSYPQQARIYIDGMNTFQYTPAVFSIPFPQSGVHVIRLSKTGYNDYQEVIQTEPNGSYMVFGVLSNSVYPRPVITIADPLDNSTYHISDINITGTILLEDAYHNFYNYTGSGAYANVNGAEYPLTVENGQFYADILLTEGANQIYVRCLTAGGVSGVSNTITVNCVSQSANMIYVPGGSFTMGRTTGSGGSDELPTHTVTLSSFYIGQYEVTQAEYSQYMQPSSIWTSQYGLGDNYPAYWVSWYAILKYCNLRSMAEGLTPVYSISGSTNPANWGTVPTSGYNTAWDNAICNWNANGYRLPTEAEWEYAARGAVDPPDYLYSGSDDINAVAWYSGNNSPYGTKPVGTKVPNELGIYDMSGNLWEWCWDWYSSSYYSSSPANNPTGPASGSFRVGRGGSWDANANYCRVANRDRSHPYHSYYIIGFRLCRAVP